MTTIYLVQSGLLSLISLIAFHDNGFDVFYANAQVLCDQDPCKNEGVCINGSLNGIPTFQCACPAYAVRPLCEIVFCSENPCLNGGTCVRTEHGDQCLCTSVLHRKPYCSQDCTNTGCHNGGICTVYGICNCQDGFSGPNCDYVDECATSQHECDDSAVCLDTLHGYICKCKQGYSGGMYIPPAASTCASTISSGNAGAVVSEDSPEGEIIYRICHLPNKADSYFYVSTEIVPGSAEEVSDFVPVTAEPQKIPAGQRCTEFKVDIVNDELPEQTEVLVLTATTLSGVIVQRFFVIIVDDDREYPADNPCGNNKHQCGEDSTCLYESSGYYCSCNYFQYRFGGAYVPPSPSTCQLDPNPCLTNLHQCGKDAICVASGLSYSCQCNPGYKNGYYRVHPEAGCEVLIVNQCTINQHQCGPASICVGSESGYYCKCKPGYTPATYTPPEPSTCQVARVNECEDLMYQNGCDITSTCVDTDFGYYCRCNPGYGDGKVYTPSIWQKSICSPDPCTNNNCGDTSYCRRSLPPYRCQCKGSSQWYTPPSPDICPALVDECATGQHKCEEDSICLDHNKGYYCKCKPGYIGGFYRSWEDPTCVSFNSLVDECTEGTHSCTNNATCIDEPRGYYCKCKPGYLGRGYKPPQAPVCQLKDPYLMSDACNETQRLSCAEDSECELVQGGAYCKCKTSYSGYGYFSGQNSTCVPVNECESNPCNVGSLCVDTKSGYYCQCQPGYIGGVYVIPSPPCVPDCETVSFNTSCLNQCKCDEETCDNQTGVCHTNCVLFGCYAELDGVRSNQIGSNSSITVTCRLKASTSRIFDMFHLMLSGGLNNTFNMSRVVDVQELLINRVLIEKTFRVDSVNGTDKIFCSLVRNNELIDLVDVPAVVTDSKRDMEENTTTGNQSSFPLFYFAFLGLIPLVTIFAAVIFFLLRSKKSVKSSTTNSDCNSEREDAGANTVTSAYSYDDVPLDRHSYSRPVYNTYENSTAYATSIEKRSPYYMTVGENESNTQYTDPDRDISHGRRQPFH